MRFHHFKKSNGRINSFVIKKRWAYGMQHIRWFLTMKWQQIGFIINRPSQKVTTAHHRRQWAAHGIVTFCVKVLLITTFLAQNVLLVHHVHLIHILLIDNNLLLIFHVVLYLKVVNYPLVYNLKYLRHCCFVSRKQQFEG